LWAGPPGRSFKPQKNFCCRIEAELYNGDGGIRTLISVARKLIKGDLIMERRR
jgi:hypothetical protein